jgi:protein-tyrosine phosphatase
MRILMVCLGNICRSPLAHGILESKLPEGWIVDSAGTSSWHEGERPDTRSILEAKKNNINIDHQHSRSVRAQDFYDFDIIFAMDSSNYSNLCKMAPEEGLKSKIRLIMNEVEPGKNIQVPDPYTGGQSGFSHVFGMLEEAIDAFLEKNT